MKKQLVSKLRERLSPEARLELKQAAARLRECAERASVWCWQIFRRAPTGGISHTFIYIGRRSRRELALSYFAVAGAVTSHADASRNARSSSVIVGDLPMAGALRVPCAVRAVVPLDQPIEHIMDGYGEKLRRIVRQQRAHCHVRRALDDNDIERAEHEMLRPYAVARHGAGAAQLGDGVVKKMAREYGNLDIVYYDDEAVACHLGFETIRCGKRYWNALRFGFAKEVFANPKRLHEINSINIHFAMERAIENGFHFYDIGDCVGRPDDGLLRWKRRRGGHVDVSLNHAFFRVRLPSVGSPNLLWESPLFAVDRDGLALHLGLPDGRTDEEVAIRYREIGYGGLSNIYLHCTRLPNPRLFENLQALFPRTGSRPVVKSVVAA